MTQSTSTSRNEKADAPTSAFFNSQSTSGDIFHQYGGQGKYDEARRLHTYGLKLCELHHNSKRPVGDGWNNHAVTGVRPDAGGYGLMLAKNGMCSVDVDTEGLCQEGLARCGFDLEKIRGLGVHTSSTRPGSGGRVTFKVPVAAGLRWLKFSSKTHGTILELRAESPNLQDTLPGTVYHSQDGSGPWVQDYDAGGLWTLDCAPELPADLLAWWQRMSTDVDYLREQQALLVGEHVHLAISSGGGSLAFASPYRVTYNSEHRAHEILERHDYTLARNGRYAPKTATGAAAVRAIPGRDDLWQSDHASDPLFGTFDAWTAHVVLDCGGDLLRAESEAETSREIATVADFGEVDTAAERNNDQARLNASRRELQRLENIRIGEGGAKVPAVGTITLEDARQNFVFLSDGSQVADLRQPGNAYAFTDFAATYAASRQGGDKKIPVASLWKTDPHRMTAEALTFKAGGPVLLRDPNGRMAVNAWRPILREGGQDLMAAGLFLDHVEFLFPIAADRERFLDWLAHIEQKPGELPHTAWLHVARNFGMGRNWLASVLARVWGGYVAANLDLPGVLKSGFNGRLSRKILAVVDEIREGGRDGPWDHAEKLKSIITEEVRAVNPKYGRQSVEFNACRFLLFSNHVSAIPLETGDRRIEVVSIDAAPRSSDYYQKLYAALDDPKFINAVGVWLEKRDLSRFNPGAHARMSEAKMKVVQASLSPMAERCQTLTHLWPSDLIKAADLYSVLQGPSGGDGSLTAFHRRTLEQSQVEPIKKPVRVSPGCGGTVRVSVLRNHEKWRNADAGAIRAELAKCPDAFDGAWDWLAGAEADQAPGT